MNCHCHFRHCPRRSVATDGTVAQGQIAVTEDGTPQTSATTAGTAKRTTTATDSPPIGERQIIECQGSAGRHFKQAEIGSRGVPR